MLAAGKVFAAKGYEAATIRDVAAEAKTQVGGIMHHFVTKDDLYLAVIKTFILDSGRWDYIFEPLSHKKKVTPQLLEELIGECVKRYMYQNRPGQQPFENLLGLRLAVDEVPTIEEIRFKVAGIACDQINAVLKQAYPQLTEKQMLDWRTSFYALLLFPETTQRSIHGRELPPGYHRESAKRVTADACALLRAKASSRRS
ncbi:MAG: TetR/AcrR family transcriptional regulator [Verrucomicrobiales bacterium]|nr:TetR/AcrR family transcriptional regulator [Verrucomicrobiales bacterium]